MNYVTYKSIKSSFYIGITSLLVITSAYAGKINLSTSPLFVASGVESNVYFVLDDSGSMDWELMVGSGLTDYQTSSGLAVIDDTYRFYMHPSSGQQWEVVPTVETNSEAWMLRNSIANPLYYNPKTTYYPWPGTDVLGAVLYADADPTAALEYPQNAGSSTADLTKDTNYRKWWWSNGWKYSDHNIYFAVYYNWIDDDNDGVIELSDSYETVEIKPGNTALFETVDIKEADGSVSTRQRTYAEEMQNYANWFQYYRKREFAAKVAIGNVIDGTDSVRMGLDLINAGHIFDATSMSNATDRAKLLGDFYNISSGGGTPLRRALNRVGKMFDGSSSVASPILSSANGGQCQQNFQMLMTDGYWNGYDSYTSGTIGNEDGDDDTVFDGGNYADAHSNTLADVAMYYYENDLAPSLVNEVPTIDGLDEASHQHLVTYTVAFGLKGELDYETLDPNAGEVVWPKPQANSVTAIDDLWHAAYNGRGQYLNAAYPEQLTAALDEIINDIAERSATASAVAINSAKLTTDTIIYLAEFNTYRWQGEIYAYKIIDINTGQLKATPEWQAADVLNARDIGITPRVMMTFNGNVGTAFQWADITNAQKDDLRANSIGGTDLDVVAQAKLNYIRGDRSNEGNNYFFRERITILGDIVNSGPVYVSGPDLGWPDTAPFPTTDLYSTFKKANANREGVVYVGANDGMLHAFSESAGEELFAYIPNILFSTGAKEGMHYTASSDYSHKFYNDLTPTISDVYINKLGGSVGSSSWNTVLIGGLRGGGRGLYALNITDPSSFAENKAADMVMWEFSNAIDSDLGYTYSKPQIALANNGKWVAIFGNGYNANGSGESALFIVDIEAGIDGWDAGDYIKISTGSGSALNVNGLSTPVLADTDGDGDVDRVYAGDLEGQLWAFDLSSTNEASWGLVDTKPLFTTIGNRPITAKPTLSLHPTKSTQTTNKPNLMVYFGSGQYLEGADIADKTLNHFYGVWDSGTYNLTYSSLVQQSVDSNFANARVMTKNSVDYATKKGWYFELEDPGERSVTTAVVRFDAVFFNTFTPSGNACSSGGSGFRMAVDSATGGSLDDPAFDSNLDGVVDKNDTTTSNGITSTVSGIAQDGYLPEPVFIEDLSFTAEKAIKVSEEPDVKSGRLSWQELLK